MSVKKFGIFVSHNPHVDLRAEGLGRHLAMLIKGAIEGEGVKISIACPSWSRTNLRELLEEFDVPANSYEIIGPEKSSLFWTCVNFFSTFRKRVGRKKRKIHTGRRRLTKAIAAVRRLASKAVKFFVRSRNPLVFAPGFIAGVIVFPPILIVGAILWTLWRLLKLTKRAALTAYYRTKTRLSFIKHVVSALRSQLYQMALDEEATLVARDANRRRDIPVWYCPAAFWPQANKIQAPTLICVPDVVPINFPVGFSKQGGPQMLVRYRTIEKTIRGGRNFVTYSEEIKNSTLIKRFGVDAKNVHTVRHGASRLDHLVTVTGFPDNEKAADTMCTQYLSAAMTKAANNWHGSRFASSDLAYFLYASQFRPNKNVLTLLRAFRWLRREKILHYKLILTGDVLNDEPIRSFLNENELNDDVLCLRKLTEKELAAVYYKAALAINPSLSEGGTPFTLGEALSVGTPVIMSDIPVSRETIVDPVVYEMTTFNGMDWRSLADKVLWALENRDKLLNAQQEFYGAHVKCRTWQDVSREYLEILGGMENSVTKVRFGKQ